MKSTSEQMGHGKTVEGEACRGNELLGHAFLSALIQDILPHPPHHDGDNSDTMKKINLPSFSCSCRAGHGDNNTDLHTNHSINMSSHGFEDAMGKGSSETGA